MHKRREDTSTAHQKALLMKMFDTDDEYIHRKGVCVYINTSLRLGFIRLEEGKFYYYDYRSRARKSKIEVYADGTSALENDYGYDTPAPVLTWRILQNHRLRRENGQYYTNRSP